MDMHLVSFLPEEKNIRGVPSQSKGPTPEHQDVCFVHSKVPSIKSHIIALYEPLRKQELVSQLWDTLTGRQGLLSRCQT